MLLLLLLPFSTRAATEDVDKKITEIEHCYKRTKYEDALKLVHEAQRESPSEQQKVMLWLYEGILLYELGEGNAEVERKLRIALEKDRTAEPRVEVPPKIRESIERIRRQIPTPPLTPPVPPPGPTHSTLQKLALIPAIAGGALVVAGGGFYAASRWDAYRLRNNDPKISTQKDAQTIGYQGRTAQALGGGLLGLGAAGLATSVVMYLLGAPKKESVSLGVGTDGTSALVYGRWP